MSKLLTFIKKAFSYPGELYKTHPVTAVSVIAATVVFAIRAFIEAASGYDPKGVFPDLVFFTGLAIAFFAVFSLCLESIRPRWSTPVKTSVFAFFFILSFLMSFINYDTDGRTSLGFLSSLSDFANRVGEYSVILFIAGLIITALLIALYFSYSHDVSQRFNEHIVNSYSKLFFTSIIYGVVQCGVIMLTVIVSLLLFEDAFDYLLPVIILILGLFYVPAVIIAVTRQNERANFFVEILVRYVMLTISVIAYAIIYIYIIKLVITLSVPSNSVFAILTALFVITLFITYMCTAYEKKGFLQKFAYFSPMIFAPFIIMQCYTVFVRIGQYGLTPKRYFGIAFIIFEISYIVYYSYMMIKESETAGRSILLIICAFVIITFLLPGINAKSLSNSIARHSLSSYLKKAAENAVISDREYMHANAAYGYLSDTGFGENRINRYFSGIDADTVTNLRKMASEAAERQRGLSLSANADRDETEYVWFNSNMEDIEGDHYVDISGYKNMVHVRMTSGDVTDSEKDRSIDLSKLTVYRYDDDGLYGNEASDVPECPTVDLSGFVEKCHKLFKQYDADIITVDEYRKQCAPAAKIDVNENARLYITDASIDINEKNGILNFNAEGYLLLK